MVLYLLNQNPNSQNHLFMKNLFIFILSALISVNLSANDNEKVLKSDIESVTVYQRGAQVFRNSTGYLTKGRWKIVISKLSMQIDPNSIQVSGKGNFTILSVHHRLNYLEKIEVKEKIKILNDSSTLLIKKIDYNNQLINLYNKEVNMIEKNNHLNGQSHLNVQDFKTFTEYYRARNKELMDKLFELKYENQKLQDILNRINNQIRSEKLIEKASAVSEIVVDVEVNTNTNVKLSANYIVNGAGWSPIYDLRSEKINEPLKLHYRANVYQTTGIDWENVKLSISTGNPNKSGTMPHLNPWYLQYYLTNQRSKSLSYSKAPSQSKRIEATSASDDLESIKEISYDMAAGSSANYTSVSDNQTNTVFEISIPYNISSGEKNVSIKIQESDLPATYRYYCAPKLDRDAFLQARVTGWEDLNLLAGPVNIFFDGAYVGKSNLNPRNIGDTLEISLGRDESIIIERKKIKDKNSSGIFGNNKKIVSKYEIEIKNTKSVDIDIIIKDHIPISRLDKIEVSLDEKSEGTLYNEKTGILEWEFKLKSKESKKLSYKFTVKYPKEYTVNVN